MFKNIVLGALGMMIATSAMAGDRPILDSSRAAGGIAGGALWSQEESRVYAVPSAWLSWSLTENMALKASQEYVTDRGDTPFRLGARLYVPDSTKAYRVGLGVNYLRDWDTANHDWSVGLYAGWAVARDLAAQVSYEKIVNAGRREARIGLAYKLFGGW